MFDRRQFRFRALFTVVLLIVVVAPLLRQGPGGAYLLQFLLTAVFLSALNAVSKGKRSLGVGLVLVLPAIMASWAARFLPGSESLALVDVAFSAAFLCFIIAHILAYVFRARRVTSEILFGALSVYLLIGLVFALAFTTLELLQPGSLSLPGGGFDHGLVDARPFSIITYFSYVTMTTLGYGDIGPLTPAARSLATFEALLGQLFLAVLIARLIALHIMHETKGTPERENE
jgi:voltage-gated potassium channel Kch